MKRRYWIGIVICGAAVLTAGCDALSALLPMLVTVSLENTGDFNVDGAFLISDEQDIPEFLLKEVGDEQDFTVPPGGTQTFVYDCDELQAIMIEHADLRIIGGLGPEASTDVLRDGHEFSCGSTITFTFSHSVILTDFDVTYSVTNH